MGKNPHRTRLEDTLPPLEDPDSGADVAETADPEVQ